MGKRKEGIVEVDGTNCVIHSNKLIYLLEVFIRYIFNTWNNELCQVRHNQELSHEATEMLIDIFIKIEF